MLSKAFQLPISDLAAELQHILISVRSGPTPGRGQSGCFSSAALSWRALDTWSYTSPNSCLVTRKCHECCYTVKILKYLSTGRISLHPNQCGKSEKVFVCVHAQSLSRV